MMGAIRVLTYFLAAASQTAELPTDLDPGGRILERVAVEEGVRSFQCNSLAPDGRSIAIGWERSEDDRGTYLLDLSTGRRTELVEFNNGAIFSPDGRYLSNAIYVEDGKTDLVELDLESRELRTIAPHDEWDWLPDYSPDGSSIVFNSYRSGNSDIYLYDRESEALRRMTDSDRYEAHAQFSPDGGRIVFHRQVGESDFDLYLMDVESGEERRLTDSPHEESYPSWAPDGRHIYFGCDRGNEPGKLNLFVMTDTGELVRQLTDHPEKDAYPFASPDGEYLYFNSYREPQGVYRVKLTPASRDGEQ